MSFLSKGYFADLERRVEELTAGRDEARAEAALYLGVLRERHPMVILAARWPGYATICGLGVLVGLALADVWGAWVP